LVVDFTGVVGVLPPPVVPEPVLDEPEPDEPDPDELEPDGGLTAVVFGGVVEAIVVVVPAPCERSIVPVFAWAAAVDGSAEVAAALLEPDSPPQAARVSVAREHRRTLRKRAARAS
jgi:hypothetical protein